MPFRGGRADSTSSCPAPAYVTALDPADRDRLRARLHARFAGEGDRVRPLQARAWAVRGVRA
jgi:hypothetical protein